MKVRLTAPARRDIASILLNSQRQFGVEARERYRRLIERAMEDLRSDPTRPGVTSPAGAPAGLWVYHVRHARARLSASLRVGRPRHCLVFRVMGERIVVVRVLHDAMDLPTQLSDL